VPPQPDRKSDPTSPRKRGEVGRSISLIQPSQNLIQLFEVAVADVDGAAGLAMIDANG
jgi:hypothetical protein